MIHSCQLLKHRKSAFALLRWLLLIGIIAVLSVMAVSYFQKANKSQTMTGAVVLINNILNNARQEAIEKKTYVYVAFNKPDATDDTLWIMTFAANDKSGQLDLSSDISINLPVNSLRFIALSSFPHLLLKDKGELSASSLPNSAASNPNIDSLSDATVNANIAEKKLNLKRLLVFTPDGQAMSEAELNQYIEFGLVSSTDKEAKDPAIFRISGNPGVVTVYRN